MTASVAAQAPPVAPVDEGFFDSHPKEFESLLPRIFSYLSLGTRFFPGDQGEAAVALMKSRADLKLRDQTQMQQKQSGLVTRDTIARALLLKIEDRGKVTWQYLVSYRKIKGKEFSSDKDLELDLSGSDVTDDRLRDILRRLPNVQKCRFNHCKNIQLRTVVEFIQNRRRESLQALLHQERQAVVQQMFHDEKALIELCSKDAELKKLAEEGNFQGILDKIGNDQDNISKAVGRIKKSKSEFESKINEWANGDNPTLKTLARNYLGLESIDLTECTQATFAQIKELVENCFHLKILNLSGLREITDENLLEIVEKCRHLHTLNLSWCGNILGTKFKELAENCPNLHSLILLGCDRITGDGIETLLNSFLRLHDLNLSHFSIITFEGIKVLNCLLLRNLNLRACDGLTGNGLLKIVEKCPHLQTIDLVFCLKLTKEEIASLWSLCPQLEEIIDPWGNVRQKPFAEFAAEGCAKEALAAASMELPLSKVSVQDEKKVGLNPFAAPAAVSAEESLVAASAGLSSNVQVGLPPVQAPAATPIAARSSVAVPAQPKIVSKASQYASLSITAIHIASTLALGWLASYGVGSQIATTATALYLAHRYSLITG